jgi:hypothetical protein
MFGFDTVFDFISTYVGRKIDADHVATNFWKAAKRAVAYNEHSENQRCIGKHNSHWYMLEYLKQYISNYENHNRFAYVHLNPGHENTGSVIKTVDTDVVNFLSSVLSNYDAKNEDIVLVLTADHGK